MDQNFSLKSQKLLQHFSLSESSRMTPDRYPRCVTDTQDVLQIPKMCCRYPRCVADTEDVLQIPKMCCRYPRCVADTQDVLFFPGNKPVPLMQFFVLVSYVAFVLSLFPSEALGKLCLVTKAFPRYLHYICLLSFQLSFP